MSQKLVQINVVCNGSTGRIMTQIQKEAEKQGWETYSFYGRGKPANDKCFKIGNKLDVLFHVFLTRVFDKHGHGSKGATKKLIKRLEEINPDVIQLHNIHGYYLNIEILFDYLRKCNKKIIWTLHDCWAFTGHCTHFSYPKCEKWKKGCSECARKREYPGSILKDNSKVEYQIKKELFTGIQNLTIVTPSNWLADLVKKSFLEKYPIMVINNGIDIDIFKSSNTVNIREKYNISENKKIILGVAAIWDKRKGLEEFIELEKHITDEYVIVLVGLNKEQIKKLPNKIIGIKRTENLEELVNLYTAAEVLYNPSKEETFSLVTAEAMACGTPVIAYSNSAVKELIETTQNEMLLNVDEDLNINIKLIMDYIKNIDKLEFKECRQYTIKMMTSKYIKLYKDR